MADPRGFLEHPRQSPPKRPVDVRISDWREILAPFPPGELRAQAARCMDCGVPFCHSGCPLGNRIPEWNDLVRRDDWRAAIEALHATNNFPEFTGTVCPAPCESACVLALRNAPVTIKTVEVAIADRAWSEGWVTPQPAEHRTGRRVAVVGSGPAGLAAAQQLVRVGHGVTVFERDDRPGGLLRYGIPEFKLEKRHVNRRIDQLRAEGVEFGTGVDVGVDIPAAELLAGYDAVLLATGALAARELAIAGRELPGVHLAMDYLTPANRVQEGDLAASPIDAGGRDVVIIGGGDTGADCYGTAIRQGAASVTQLMIHPRPPEEANPATPWPTWPLILRTAPVHEEGGDRLFGIQTHRLLAGADGRVSALVVSDVRRTPAGWEAVPDTERALPCDLALIAIGYTGPDCTALLDELRLARTPTGAIGRDGDWATTVPGVFVAGDAGRGQSLIVWAIAEGRAAAAAIDRRLAGATRLPALVSPGARALI